MRRQVIWALAVTSLLTGCSPSVEPATRTRELLSDKVTAYFYSEQRYSLPNGHTPWHVAAPGSDERRSTGMPVPWKEYVFPGGPEARVVWNADGSAAGGPWLEQTVGLLTKGDVIELDHQIWALSYESNGTAEYAEVRLKVALREQPESTISSTVEVVDKTQDVVRTPLVFRNLPH